MEYLHNTKQDIRCWDLMSFSDTDNEIYQSTTPHQSIMPSHKNSDLLSLVLYVLFARKPPLYHKMRIPTYPQ